ncbi:beta-fructofuranosidase [Xylocopilactobacillus apis]|uniref:beta-fructofuranosidase n=2 Tax=Xylocopilactobacillus apis TaxID=2932183 RepID=A0AAU9DFE9_9LACO|nr:beta-fructofuranosidase [Xylocopilactobacillus apis]
MPFYNFKNESYYLYFQKDTRNPVPFGEPFGWQLVITKDFVNYQSYGEVLNKGNDNEQDQFIYAGSVFLDKEKKLTAYYTGYNQNWINKKRPSQVLMKAHSLDGIHWTKEGIIKSLSPRTGYDNDDWRDPNVVWDEKSQEYLLILGTRLEGDKKCKTGRIVYFTSKDCSSWNFKGDFFSPNIYTMIEMPELIKIGDWWYLIYSEYDFKKTTHYCMSKDLYGPWIIPSVDTFSGRAYYAARICSNGKKFYLCGWVPSKEAGKDTNNYLWGGTFLPLEVVSTSNGLLETRLIDSITESAKPKLSAPKKIIKSLNKRSEFMINSNLKKNYLFSMDFLFRKSKGYLGIIFFESQDTNEGYELIISIDDQEISINRTPNLRWFQLLNIGLNRKINICKNKWYHLDLLIDDTVIILSINGTVLSCRVEKTNKSCLGISVTNSICEIK